MWSRVALFAFRCCPLTQRVTEHTVTRLSYQSWVSGWLPARACALKALGGPWAWVCARPVGYVPGSEAPSDGVLSGSHRGLCPGCWRWFVQPPAAWEPPGPSHRRVVQLAHPGGLEGEEWEDAGGRVDSLFPDDQTPHVWQSLPSRVSCLGGPVLPRGVSPVFRVRCLSFLAGVREFLSMSSPWRHGRFSPTLGHVCLFALSVVSASPEGLLVDLREGGRKGETEGEQH